MKKPPGPGALMSGYSTGDRRGGRRDDEVTFPAPSALHGEPPFIIKGFASASAQQDVKERDPQSRSVSSVSLHLGFIHTKDNFLGDILLPLCINHAKLSI